MIRSISMLGNAEAPIAPANVVTNPQEAPKVDMTPPQDSFVPSQQEQAPVQADPNDKFEKTEEQPK